MALPRTHRDVVVFGQPVSLKVVTLPDGTAFKPRAWDKDPTPIQLALARGHQWLGLLESGKAKNLSEVAEQVGMDRAYVSRMVNLTMLAPDIVEAILSRYQVEREQCARDLKALQLKKQQANNNLAGATWEGSISGEMTALATTCDTRNRELREDAAALRTECRQLGGCK